jgi:uncharacterized protein (DUF1800 family)
VWRKSAPPVAPSTASNYDQPSKERSINVAVDRNLFFARRLGLGLAPGEDLPVPPREWALEQLRSVPPLDYFEKGGESILPTLPDYARPLEDFEQAMHQYEVRHLLELEFAELSKTLPRDEFDRRKWEEILYPYWRLPRWRDCLIQSMTAVNGASPVFERFWWFWCNHFTVSTTNTDNTMVYGAHLRLIRSRMTGKFEDLLFDAIANPAMLVYLDNESSSGPNSPAAKQEKGSVDLNENLAREVLELHTVSPAAGYDQKDVVETALLLTGWQYYAGPSSNGGYTEKVKYGTRFNPYRHEPGSRTIMGKKYRSKGAGENMLRLLIADLALHPSTIRHLSFKLARAFVADEPPADSVDRIAAVFADSKGDLVAIHSAVVEEVLAVAERYPKFTTPVNWLLQAYKATGANVPVAEPNGQVESIHFLYRELGQTFDECPQPNGYSDLMADWLSKALVDRRVRQAYRIGISARDLSVDAIGDYAARLAGGADSPLATLVRRAESRSIAVTILLASPQFLKI